MISVGTEDSTHVHNQAVDGLSLCPLCSTELSPICPSLNICCGNAAVAAGPIPPIWRGEYTFDWQQQSINHHSTPRSKIPPAGTAFLIAQW